MTDNGGTKIVHNGDKESQVVFSALIRWGSQIATGVAVVLIAAAVLSAASFFRRIDQTITSMDNLTNTVEALVEQSKYEWENSRSEAAELRLGQEQLKRRVTLLDKKID